MLEIKRKPQSLQEAAQKPQNSTERAEMTTGGVFSNCAINTTLNTENALKGQKKPFTAIDGSNYRAAYRAVCDFHERHNPPPFLDDKRAEAYWESVCDDMVATARRFNNDPFLSDLLAAVFSELERQYIMLQQGGGA